MKVGARVRPRRPQYPLIKEYTSNHIRDPIIIVEIYSLIKGCWSLWDNPAPPPSKPWESFRSRSVSCCARPGRQHAPQTACGHKRKRAKAEAWRDELRLSFESSRPKNTRQNFRCKPRSIANYSDRYPQDLILRISLSFRNIVSRSS